MSKHTLILIIVLMGITALLLAIALTPKESPVPIKQAPTPSISYAQTSLKIDSNPTAATSTTSAVPLYSTDVTITTGDNKVNAVQLELSFDASLLYNVDIKPGPLFKDGVELLPKKINYQNGTISYVIASPLGQKGFSGSGVVAVISFSEKGNPGDLAQISFLPKTKVTAQGTDKSVLKSAVSATFPIAGTPVTPAQQNTVTPSGQPVYSQ